MQTMAIQIQDDYVNNHSDSIIITKDKNLEYDPYFYERQKELHQIKSNIDNGKVQIIESDEFWDDIDDFVETLQK
jgi:hypothetical protein